MKPIELNKYCPCCGYDSFDAKDRLEYSICPICFWEDDPIQFNEPKYEGGANRASLIQGQKNFKEFGACEKKMVQNVRKPHSGDNLNPSWIN